MASRYDGVSAYMSKMSNQAFNDIVTCCFLSLYMQPAGDDAHTGKGSSSRRLFPDDSDDPAAAVVDRPMQPRSVGFEEQQAVADEDERVEERVGSGSGSDDVEAPPPAASAAAVGRGKSKRAAARQTARAVAAAVGKGTVPPAAAAADTLAGADADAEAAPMISVSVCLVCSSCK